MNFFEFLSAYVLKIEAMQGWSRATPNLNVYFDTSYIDSILLFRDGGNPPSESQQSILQLQVQTRL